MAVLDEKTQKELKFSEFVVNQLKLEHRVKNILTILLQDIYLFLGRCGAKESPEYPRVEKLLEAIDLAHGDPMQLEEGWINRQKDEAIRTMFVYELMRQWTNFKKKPIVKE